MFTSFDKSIVLLFTLLLLINISCSEKELIPEEKFIKIYVDILIAQDTSSLANPSIDSLKTIVFERYEITDELYQQNIDYYNESPEKWDKFFDRAIKYVEELKANNPD